MVNWVKEQTHATSMLLYTKTSGEIALYLYCGKHQILQETTGCIQFKEQKQKGSAAFTML